MAERKARKSDRSPAERLAAIEQGQARLLSELDELDDRVEAALLAHGPNQDSATMLGKS